MVSKGYYISKTNENSDICSGCHRFSRYVTKKALVYFIGILKPVSVLSCPFFFPPLLMHLNLAVRLAW